MYFLALWALFLGLIYYLYTATAILCQVENLWAEMDAYVYAKVEAKLKVNQEAKQKGYLESNQQAKLGTQLGQNLYTFLTYWLAFNICHIYIFYLTYIILD